MSRRTSTLRPAAAENIRPAVEQLEARCLLSAVSFGAAQSYPTGTGPDFVASADFNGDGKADLAVADFANTVSVLMNKGNGTFAAKVNYATGEEYTMAVATGDFNGDGKPDLAVANYSYASQTNSVSVLLNTGGGVFTAKVDYLTGWGSSSVTAGDFNGDGKIDLAVGNCLGNSVSILLNKGNGTFAAKVDYPTGNFPAAIAMADFNADGLADLAVANGYGHTVSVLLNTGGGVFATKTDYHTGRYPQSVTSADFNGDGLSDIAVANLSGTVNVLLNAGSGTFAAKTDYAAVGGAVTSADFNSDGKADLAVSNFGQNSGSAVSILLNTGDGVFAAAASYAATGACVISADFNADGKADLALADAAEDMVVVLLNTGTYDSPVVTNQPPTNITLSNATVPENAAVGSTVGTLATTDPDAADTFTYTLVSGTGSADNAAFALAGNALATNTTFDYATQSSYSIRVRTADQDGLYFEKTFTVSIAPIVVTPAPTDITLSIATVAENSPAGAAVGTFATVGTAVGDTVTFALTDGEGAADNAAFRIVAGQLQAGASFDYETRDTYAVRVRATNGGGVYFEKAFAISVADVNESPAMDGDTFFIAENAAVDAGVGIVYAIDPDASQSVTYSILSGNTGNAFAIELATGIITVAASSALNYETRTSYTLSVQARDDGSPALSATAVITINITNVNESPTGIALSGAAISADLPAGASIGTLTTADPDAGDTFTYSLVAGAGAANNAMFAIDGNSLTTAAGCPYDIGDSYTVRVRSTDSGGESVESTFTLNAARYTLPLDAKGRATFTDADGTGVTVSLSGGGSGTIYFAHAGWCDASRIVLSGTGEKSALTITTKGPGDGTTLGGIDTGGGPIGSIVASTSDLSGDVRIGAIANSKSAVSLTFDQIRNASIVSSMPVKSLTAAEWIDDDDVSDILSAPYATTITINGKKAKAGVATVRGDFQADLNLGAPGVTSMAITTLSVTGVIDGSAVTATVHNASGVSVGTIKAGRVDSMTILADGGVNSLSMSQWQAGGITAGWVGSIVTKSAAAIGGAGHFGANLALTGAFLPAGKATLGSVSIAGSLLGGTQWDVRSGTAGTLQISGTVDHSIICVAGDITSLTIGAADTSDFGAGVSFGDLQTARQSAVGDIVPTGTIKTMTIAGLKLAKGQAIPRFFIDSNIYAKIGKLNLLNWDGHGGLFAPASAVKSVVHKDTANNANNWSWPPPARQVSAGPTNFIHTL